MSAYLLGNIIFLIVWLALFFVSPKTRKFQLTGGILLLPFSLLDIWFRPVYWHPPLLIRAIEPLSIETLFYCFTAGGIVAVFGPAIIKYENIIPDIKKIILFWLAAFGLYAIFQGFDISSAMNNLNFTFLIIWLACLFLDLRTNIRSLIPAVIFAFFTIIAIRIGLLFFPGFVTDYWNLNKLWPTFLGAPTEEIFFASILGALWTTLPRYLNNHKIENKI